VSPILGIWASQNYSRTPTTGFVSIATTTVGSGGTSSISFTGIPSVYKHLQIRGILRSTAADVTDMPRLVINSDTTAANYRAHGIQVNGGSIYPTDISGDPYLRFGRIAAANNASAMFAPVVLDLLDYQNTNKNKVIRVLNGNNVNDNDGWLTYFSGLWMSTSAVTTLTITTSANIAQYSQLALYGIQG
jgi:hypothetical protein